MVHPIAILIRDNLEQVNKCWSDLIRLKLVLAIELSYIDKYSTTWQYIPALYIVHNNNYRP